MPPSPAPPDSTAADAPYLLLLADAAYRTAQEKKLIARIAEAGFEVRLFKPGSGAARFGLPEFLRGGPMPAAILRWEENGGLYGSMRVYRTLAKWCYQEGIAPIAVDFAFFDHYNGFSFDLLGEDGRSGIHRDWNALPSSIDFDRIPGKAGDHIRFIRTVYEEERGRLPRHGNIAAAAFLQAELRRCRLPMDPASPSEWIRVLYEIFRERIVFKSAPSPTLRPLEFPDGARHFSGRKTKNLEKLVRLNAQLAVHADYVITNNSGVTNEFVVTDIPVMTTGRSFFSGHEVFEEAESWENFYHPDGWRPAIDREARARYIHWFLQHQCLHGEPSTILTDLLARFGKTAGSSIPQP